MHGYSFAGYRLAIKLRSKKTVLVEGKSDKSLFQRFIVSRAPNPELADIDTADIFSGEDVRGLGARAKIDRFIEELNDDDDLKSRLVAFLDREWDGLIGDGDYFTDWSDPDQSENRWVSRGHSIENYSFSSDCVISYLEHFGHGVCTREICDNVCRNLKFLLAFAVAFSEIAFRRGIISRLGGILRYNDIAVDDRGVRLDASLSDRLKERGVPNFDS